MTYVSSRCHWVLVATCAAPDVAAWKVAVNDGVVTKHMHSNVHSAVLCVPSPWRSGALQVDDA